ncbi:MAG: class I SAM-dependent methyltransferase [Methanoregula sp.]|jgi:predicted O-methyltransferase YrrM
MNWNFIKSYKEHQVNKKIKKFSNRTYDLSKPSLSSLMIKFRAFDNKDGTDKDTLHSYIETYEKILVPLRDNARNVLEIGVYSGAFLEILADFFDNAQIYGIDIDLSNLRFGKDNPRIHIYELNGTDPDSIKKLGIKSFDLIIEDGSHIPVEQIATFNNYAPLIGPGGIYITEDINSSALTTLHPRLTQIAHANQMDFEIIDLRYVKGRYDDICMIAKKNEFSSSI